MPKVIASDFASMEDVRRYNAAIAKGKTQQEAFAVGDNGVGLWGDKTSQMDRPACALPPDDMIAKFGSINASKEAKVLVTVRGRSVVCELDDRMPWKRNIKNGAGIDLNPAAISKLGLKSPIMVEAEWEWYEKTQPTTPTPAKKGFWKSLLFWRK